MPIEPNASSDEYSSPFFLQNERRCEEFDSFIEGLNGETRGKYNSWSYHVIGKIRHPWRWQFHIRRSVGSNGSIWLSSKKQNLHASSEWIAKNAKLSCNDFVIRKEKFKDDFLKIFSNKYHPLKLRCDYTLIGVSPSNKDIIFLTNILKDLFQDRSVEKIEFNKGILKISIFSDKLLLPTIQSMVEASTTHNNG